MAVGNRIKRVRNFRGLTQKELGLALGYDEKSADVRVAQYESGTRTPKEDTLTRIAGILDVNYRSLHEPTLYTAEEVMYTLFELDERYALGVHDVEDVKAVSFQSRILDDLLLEWQLRKQQFASGEITKEEYTEWKLNWPQTTDDCGKSKATKVWRK